MSIKVTFLIALVGLLAVHSLGHRGGGGGGFGGGRDRDRRNPFDFVRTPNVTCTARAVSQPDKPPCTTCLCFPENVLNCWTLKARFCNPPAANSTGSAPEIA